MEPTDHELNKLLADVVGVEVVEEKLSDGKIWAIYNTEGSIDDVWVPLIDHNQMAQIKACLREKYGEILQIDSFVRWSRLKGCWHYTVTIHIGMGTFNAESLKDELRAFALAVYKMEKFNQEGEQP